MALQLTPAGCVAAGPQVWPSTELGFEAVPPIIPAEMALIRRNGAQSTTDDSDQPFMRYPPLLHSFSKTIPAEDDAIPDHKDKSDD